MKTYDAYCAVCDASVRVTLDPAAEHPLADAKLECVDKAPGCDASGCPLEGATAAQLDGLLEFIPHEKHDEGEVPSTPLDLEEVVRRGRIQAMRRGDDPVP